MEKALHGWLFVSLLFGLIYSPHARASDAATPPVVNGNRITFPAGSIDAESISVFTVVARETVGSHVAGHLIWDEDCTVRVYTPLTGQVREILVHVGDEVSAGAVLARLDSPDFGQAQADAHKAAADLKLAERNLMRLRDLYAHGAVAKKEVDEAENVFESARSEQQRTVVRLRLYGENDTKDIDGSFGLSTPIAGTIVDRNVNVGEELRPDLMLANDPHFVAPLFVVTNPRRLWVALDATETELPNLKIGQPLRIRSRSYPERVFTGSIAMIGSALDPSTRTVKVVGLVENPDLSLKAELYVEVEIGALPSPSPGLIIESSAVFEYRGKTCVFIETTPGTYELQTVEVESENAGQAVVRHGLSVGQHVVGSGRLLLESLLESGGKS